MSSSCGAAEDSWMSLLQQGDQTSQNIKGDQLWTLVGRTATEAWSTSILATRCEEPIRWKSLWRGERLSAEGEEGNREWDGWMASLMQWTGTWGVSSWHATVLGVANSGTWLGDWTTAASISVRRISWKRDSADLMRAVCRWGWKEFQWSEFRLREILSMIIGFMPEFQNKNDWSMGGRKVIFFSYIMHGCPLPHTEFRSLLFFW